MSHRESERERESGVHGLVCGPPQPQPRGAREGYSAGSMREAHSAVATGQIHGGNVFGAPVNMCMNGCEMILVHDSLGDTDVQHEKQREAQHKVPGAGVQYTQCHD